jgi:hypothetical protein
VEADVVVDGVPKRYYAFAGKQGVNGFYIRILIDQRELRLRKDYIKDVLAKVSSPR